MYLANQLVRAVYDLHNHSLLAHLDIKPQNVVFTEDLKLALIDFGSSNNISESPKKILGTIIYMAPETYNINPNSCFLPEKADIFSLGMILFEIFF